MDWSTDLVQWLTSVVWGVLGIWGELIGGESNAGIENTDWGAYDDSLRASSPFGTLSGEVSPQSYTGQGNSDAYNSLNSSSLYADSGLSATSQLLAPLGLLGTSDGSSSILDVAYGNGAQDTSNWLAQNSPANAGGDPNTASDVGPSSPGVQDAGSPQTSPGGDSQGPRITEAPVAVKNDIRDDGTQWTEVYINGNFALEFPSFSDPSYVGTTSGATPISTPAPAASSPQPPPSSVDAPSGYTIAPPPQVSAPGTYNFAPHGFVWSQFQSVAREMNDANNPAWARGLLYGLGSVAAPLALFEEGLRAAVNSVSENAIRAGENMGRASLWWEQGEYGEAAEDSFFAIAEGASAFVTAAQIGQPFASAGQGDFGMEAGGAGGGGGGSTFGEEWMDATFSEKWANGGAAAFEQAARENAAATGIFVPSWALAPESQMGWSGADAALTQMSDEELQLVEDLLNAPEALVGRSGVIEGQGKFTLDNWLLTRDVQWTQGLQDVYDKALYLRAAGGVPVNVMAGGGYTLGEVTAAEAGASASGVFNLPFWPSF